MQKCLLRKSSANCAMVLKFLFVVLIYIAPQFSWGFSLARTEAYKKQALQSKLASSSQWLRLGHYRQHLIGSYYSPIRGDFFISAEGSKDPQAELLSTI